MAKTVIQQLQADEVGRQVLALTTLETPVQSVSGTVAFDTADAAGVASIAFSFVAGTIILDAKVVVTTAFDSDAGNAIVLGVGDSTVIGGSKLAFANAYDVSQPGGAAVTGSTAAGSDVPQFLPVLMPGDPTAVFATYGHTGSAPTQGAATVVLSFVQPA